MVTPSSRCPAAVVPDVVVCEPSELDELVEFLATGEPARSERSFARGTALPDGRLDLCKQSIGAGGAARVANALRGNHAITSLLLGTDAIGGPGVAALAELIASEESSLETLYLGCNRIGGAELAPLTAALETTSKTAALWLKRNPLGSDGARRIATLLRSSSSLQVLDLFNCELGDDGVALVASAASKLHVLEVGGNGVGAAAATAIARLLKTSTVLRDLSVGANPIGDRGAELLADGLKNNRSLKRLDISSCQIGPRGAAALFSALCHHPTIEVVDGSRKLAAIALGEHSNELGDSSAAPISRFVKESPALRSLDLRNAGIGSRGALLLLAAAEQQPRLSFLGLSRFVSRRIRRRLRQQLVTNRELGAIPVGIAEHVAAIRSVYRSPPGSPTR